MNEFTITLSQAELVLLLASLTDAKSVQQKFQQSCMSKGLVDMAADSIQIEVNIQSLREKILSDVDSFAK